MLVGALASIAACRSRASRVPAAGDPAFAAIAGTRVLLPTASSDFDPTETAVPWQALVRHGAVVTFATPEGRPGTCDPRMLTGDGLGRWREKLRADANGRAAWSALADSGVLARPLAYDALTLADFDVLVLPGGHAPGMKTYLESSVLQGFVGRWVAAGKPLAAICHGVLLAARSKLPGSDRSVLHGRRTTALLRRQERLAWKLTRRGLGDYYRTYPVWLEDEVTAALAGPRDFVHGPGGLRRDAPDDLRPGFTVRDGNYLSARWPGDAHRFAVDLLQMLVELRAAPQHAGDRGTR